MEQAALRVAREGCLEEVTFELRLKKEKTAAGEMLGRQNGAQVP